ncbi:MAG: cysteine desulfurase family protein [bacterium]|nr:cysteine desulfurase family protein [bacterium]
MVDTRERRIYLDYAATTPLDPAVRRAMLPYLGAAFGNPSSLHSFGQEAQAAVDRSRETVARLLGVGFRDVVFTGSATEANNLALRGVIGMARQSKRQARRVSPLASGVSAGLAEHLRSRAAALRDVPSGIPSSLTGRGSVLPKVVVSAVEHESIMETARDMERVGEAEVVVVPVDREGIVDLGALERALDERTVLVSIQYVNNETGVVQPVAKISEIIRNFREEKRKKKKEIGNDASSFFSFPFSYPLLHTDAVQAFNYLDCALPELGVDLMTLSAHKCYGPKGVGVLAMGNRQPTTDNRQRNRSTLHSSGYTLAPIVTGGGQEFGIRSGTENVAGIVGCAAALALAAERRERDAGKVGKLKKLFLIELLKRVPGTELNGVLSGTQRRNLGDCKGFAFAAPRSHAPHILNIALPQESKACTLELVVALDQHGVAVSLGSACASRMTAPSHVLQAMGMPDERIRRSLRVSFGRPTTRGEVLEAVRRMGEVLEG